MRIVQEGDRVQVHFVKRSQKGAVATSRGREPVEVVVGTKHRRLPGLGLALVGMKEGERVRVLVPADQAYGQADAGRIRKLSRSRFPSQPALLVGSWVRVTDRKGRRRPVRIVDVQDNAVVVDTNHPWAGQAIALEVEVVAIEPTEA
jgi:FKBP-type peptidyl-prolyl cis-trans isomerase 2